MNEPRGAAATIPSQYSARVDMSGRIVIPAELRDRLHVSPGDELVLQEVEGGISVKSYDQVLAEAQAYFAKIVPPGVNLVEELITERRAEAVRERTKDDPSDV